jgi:hypothetical protein
MPQVTTCFLCGGPAVASISIKVGDYHEAQDQRDTTKIETIRLCDSHYKEILAPLRFHEAKQ